MSSHVDGESFAFCLFGSDSVSLKFCGEPASGLAPSLVAPEAGAKKCAACPVEWATGRVGTELSWVERETEKPLCSCCVEHTLS